MMIIKMIENYCYRWMHKTDAITSTSVGSKFFITEMVRLASCLIIIVGIIGILNEIKYSTSLMWAGVFMGMVNLIPNLIARDAYMAERESKDEGDTGSFSK